jgi:hypothetical protein
MGCLAAVLPMMGAGMSERCPWVVRHLYSTAGRSFGPYLKHMDQLLRQAQQEGWVSHVHNFPISDASQIPAAFSDMERGELVIVDLHGWAGEEAPACLSPVGAGAYLGLDELPANSWEAAAVVFSNCRGARPQFSAAVSRLIRRRTAVTGQFDGAGVMDHTPIKVVAAILEQADGADDDGAFNAMDRVLYGRNDRWGADWIHPRIAVS